MQAVRSSNYVPYIDQSIKATLLLVKMKEKKLLKIQPLPKVLRVQAITNIKRATTKNSYVIYGTALRHSCNAPICISRASGDSGAFSLRLQSLPPLEGLYPKGLKDATPTVSGQRFDDMSGKWMHSHAHGAAYHQKGPLRVLSKVITYRTTMAGNHGMAQLRRPPGQNWVKWQNWTVFDLFVVV